MKTMSKPLLVEIIAYVDRFYHCTHCEIAGARLE
jgi:hypothetical protein